MAQNDIARFRLLLIPKTCMLHRLGSQFDGAISVEDVGADNSDREYKYVGLTSLIALEKNL